ncbi:MAG: hypothetical protein QG553_270 [Patescibacteria group bacterium]|nr:hypothetical protein [Patescibacteria group bacterium]
MPKSTKKTKSKVVTSSVGKQKPRLLVGLAIVFVIVAVAFLGTVGYSKYKENDLKAKAGSMKAFVPFSSVVDSGDGVKFVGCKTYTTVGPDSQTGKKMNVTVVASKPKDLAFNNNPNKKSSNRQPELYVDNVTPQDFTKTSITYGGAYTATWWNNEVTSMTIMNVTQGDEILAYVLSDKSVVTPYGTTNINATPNTKRTYFAAPWNNGSAPLNTPQAYQDAAKTWKTKSISATQLPNC